LTIAVICDKLIYYFLRRLKMRARSGIIIVLSVSLIFLSSIIAFAQESQIITGPDVSIDKDSDEAGVQWLWGEVLNVDSVYKQVRVRFLDFLNDTERELLLTVDADTTYENISSLEEIKPKDNLSIDYIVTADGLYLAKYIGLEEAKIGTDWNLPQEEESVSSVPGAEAIE